MILNKKNIKLVLFNFLPGDSFEISKDASDSCNSELEQAAGHEVHEAAGPLCSVQPLSSFTQTGWVLFVFVGKLILKIRK